MIRLYRAHRVVRLAVHCLFFFVCLFVCLFVFLFPVNEDVVELCSFSIRICMCPKLAFPFLELCTYTQHFTLLCQIQKQLSFLFVLS